MKKVKVTVNEIKPELQKVLKEGRIIRKATKDLSKDLRKKTGKKLGKKSQEFWRRKFNSRNKLIKTLNKYKTEAPEYNSKLVEWTKDNLVEFKKSSQSRRNNLKYLIRKYKPKTICEIGTGNAGTATELIREALRWNDTVHYVGYDLFEDESKGSLKSVSKLLNQLRLIVQKQSEYNKKFTFNIIKGDTKKTLKNKKWEFVFCDGGGDIDSVLNDWNKIKDSKLIAWQYIMRFDDMGDRGLSSNGVAHLIDFHRYTLEDNMEWEICPYFASKQCEDTRIGRANYVIYQHNGNERKKISNPGKAKIKKKETNS